MKFGNTVTLVNRTTKPLQCKWDGVEYPLPVGEIPNCPLKVARAAVTQNIQMGSRHPNNPSHFVSLFGIKGDKKWPCEPLEQSTATEALDRSKLSPAARKVVLDDFGPATSFEASLPGVNDQALEILQG